MCALIGVPWRLRMLSTFSTFSNIYMFEANRPMLRVLKLISRQGTPTTGRIRFVRFVSFRTSILPFRFVSFHCRFDHEPFRFVSLREIGRFVAFRFAGGVVSFRFVSFPRVSFRFVPLRFVSYPFL